MSKSLFIISLFFVLGCSSFLVETADSFLEKRENKHVLKKKDESCLDGPYKIITRVSATKYLVRKEKRDYVLVLRGCGEMSDEYRNKIMHSYYRDVGLYLLKESVVNTSSNEIKAVVYRPANRIFVGGTIGFENLTYVMPQLLHIAYGELCVDHTDTDYSLYPVFCRAEALAKKNRMGFWATHSDYPEVMSTNAVSVQWDDYHCLIRLR